MNAGIVFQSNIGIVQREGTGKVGHWAKRDTEVIMTSQLKLACADKTLSATC